MCLTRETAILQEAGIYQYRHPLDDAVRYKAQLDQLQQQIKVEIKAGHAVHGATHWQVDGSAAKGQAMVKDLSKLMLRAYNNEADNCVRTLKPYNLDAAIARLDKSRSTISHGFR